MHSTPAPTSRACASATSTSSPPRASTCSSTTPTAPGTASPPTPTAGHPKACYTIRQLRARGLRPGGQPVTAQILWNHHGTRRVAYLYRADLALPKRQATPAQLAAISKALAARRTCPACGTEKPLLHAALYRPVQRLHRPGAPDDTPAPAPPSSPSTSH